MQIKARDVYEAVLEADRQSRGRFSGHGSAIAQCYNHMIMPLANRRDKYTQIYWGLRDFERHFGRFAEGMWLPETAVDLETLDIMAEQGVRFTVLAPHQAKRIRKIGTIPWRDSHGGIDPTRAYRVNLPSGRSMAVFFYDGPVSRAIAFEGVLSNGEGFSKRLLDIFSDERTWPQLSHVATDGETYGHHHRYGDMALSYAIGYIENNNLAEVTNYGEFLDLNPPTHEVEIHENTSWSCAHGVERWQSDCGCRIGSNGGNQAWRKPLREALDWLRDTIAPLFESRAAEYLRDPWIARDDYVQVLFERTMPNFDAFLGRQAHRILNDGEKSVLLKLMEMQRHAMYMYTSCGWFFDDISGIEAVQVLQYAGRVIQLVRDISGQNLEEPFLERLDGAVSNVHDRGTGRDIYNAHVKPAMVDHVKMAAHYAVSSLFEIYDNRADIYCYQVDSEDYHSARAHLTGGGEARLAIGRARVKSNLTFDSKTFAWAVLYFGNHTLNCGVREYPGDEAYAAIVSDITGAFSQLDTSLTLATINRHFGSSLYSLRSLIGDQQRRIFTQILESTLTEIEDTHRHVYERNASLMKFLSHFRMPLPKALATSVEFVLNADLKRAIQADEPNLKQIMDILEEAKACRVHLDTAGLGYLISSAIEKVMARLEKHPADLALVQKLEAAMELVSKFPFDLNLWRTQNIFYDIVHRDGVNLELYRHLGEKLRVRVDTTLVR
jgi:hypothetical protein